MSKNLLRIATAAAFFLAFITSAPRAYAQTSCWKMLEEYWGPPQVENVKKCMSFSAVECLVVPHCCNPLTCLGFSDCYFFEETVVNDGSLICDLTDAEAFQQWLDGVIYNTVPNVLEPFIDLMRADARPLPEAWRTLVKQLRDSSVMPAGASFPSDAQIDGVSILGIDDAEAPLGWFISAANPNGVTFGDLVVLDDSDVDYILEHSPPDLNAALCGTLDAQSVRRIVSLLMHELTHVGQYYEMGRDAFYAAWTFNSTFNSNPLEAEATDVEDAFQIHAACANLSIEFPGFIEWGPVGSTTTIPVVVTNLGLVTAHPSSVRFQLPDGVVFQNSTESCIIFSELGFVDCITSPVLASGESWEFSITLLVEFEGSKSISAEAFLPGAMDGSSLNNVYTLPDFPRPQDIITDAAIIALDVPEILDGTAEAELSATITSMDPPQEVSNVVEGSSVGVVLPAGDHTIRWAATDGISTVVKTQRISVIHRNIAGLPNGDIQFVITFPQAQAYVEAVGRKNGVQNVAGSITTSGAPNPDGSYSYSRIVPASQYQLGDAISVRFYSYRAGQPAVYSPGPQQNIWFPTYYYGSGIDTTESCHPFIKMLPNGDVKFSATYLQPQSYAEAFVRRGSLQIAAGNIVQNAVRNSSGTFTYSRILARSKFATGDVLTTRFYSYINGQPGVFVPGPGSGVWSDQFIYGQTEDPNCLMQPPSPPQNHCVSTSLPRMSAAASSVENSDKGPLKAIDGSTGTRWSSQFSDPQWMYLDLGESRFIKRVVLNWETASSRDFDIQVAATGTGGNGPWATVATESAGNGGIDTFDNLNVVARYVRMYSRHRATSWGNSLWEFEVYGDPNPQCVP